MRKTLASAWQMLEMERGLPETSGRQKGHGHWDGHPGVRPAHLGSDPNCSGQTPFVRPGRDARCLVFGP